MSRLTPSLIALVAAAGLFAAPALAADYDDEWGGGSGGEDYGQFRDSYPVTPGQWGGLGDEDDPIEMELGLRYWYSAGGNSSAAGVKSSDVSHIGELHLRIEDHSTNTFAKAIAGYSIASEGTYSGPTSGDITDGHLGYIGADFGWNAFGNNHGTGVGILAGYQYWNDQLNTGRGNYTSATSADDIYYDTGAGGSGQTFVPGFSAGNNLNLHMMRLGVSGKADLGFLDISAEVAAVPYAKVDGSAAVDDPTFNTDDYAGTAQFPYDLTDFGNISSMRSSITEIDGWGYGAMAEGWIGIHPVDNLTFRLGARAWYLQGTVDETYTRAFIGNPVDSDVDGDYDTDPSFVNTGVLTTGNPFAMFRYGVMAEATYAF